MALGLCSTVTTMFVNNSLQRINTNNNVNPNTNTSNSNNGYSKATQNLIDENIGSNNVTISTHSNGNLSMTCDQKEINHMKNTTTHNKYKKLCNSDTRALQTQGLNEQDCYSATSGEYLTHAVLRVLMGSLNKIGDFKLYCDCLPLQQAKILPVIQTNTRFVMHVGGNHFIAAARTDRTTIDVYDRYNARQFSRETYDNLQFDFVLLLFSLLRRFCFVICYRWFKFCCIVLFCHHVGYCCLIRFFNLL